ncbi:LLM class flavin-dependent oxidoreductase [Reyranella sp.]|uniref:LLM class flavin-dependent oxidoreductase n=1 Tax=Reyranella sp. TaxID=1929291 RepID=UPI002F92DE34
MPKLGYLLPTRERVMENQPETGALLELAERAEALGFASIWVGDSVTARPRHDPLTLLAAVAARTRKAELGTAVLLPALRNPVLLAHQVATLDRIAEGRLILGIGIAADMPAIRREFEATGVPFDKRVGRMNEAMRLCKALWSGKPVDWDGLWTVKQGTVGPTPHEPGGPPIWFGGGLPAGRARTGRLYDGWFPNLPTPQEYPAQMEEVRAAARAAGRDPGAITAAMYLTLAIDDDAARADARINAYLEHYYNVPAAGMRARQRSFAGPVAAAAAWIKSYADAGVTHIMLRFAGDHERHLDLAAKIKRDLGW